MTTLSKKDKARFIETLERIDDERVRYFLMMFCDALADYAVGRKSRSHRHGRANAGPSHIRELAARLNA